MSGHIRSRKPRMAGSTRNQLLEPLPRYEYYRLPADIKQQGQAGL